MAAENNPNTEGVFLNGKAQVIEMLQYMNANEREKLLQNIRKRNPQLAEELMEKSLTFSHLGELSDPELSIIFSHINAPILGIALKGATRDFQRRLLSLAPRDYAERAYSIMMTPLQNEKVDVKRAQSKVVSSLAGLLRTRRRVNS